MPGRISEEKKKKEPELEKKVKKTERGLKKEENVDDKKLLKEAEVREKEKKVEEKIEKTEAKKAEKTAKKEVKKVEEILKTKCRIKPKHGKKYRELIKKIEKDKEYPASEAIDLAIETNPAKFDATVEAHIKISKKEKLSLIHI